MKLLKQLFNSKTVKAPGRDEQVQALNQQTPEQLLATAKGEANEALREAAINKLPYSSALVQMAQEDGGRWPILARKRLGQLLEDGSLPLDTLNQTVANPTQLLLLASYSPAAVQQLISQTQDAGLLLQLASEGSTTQVRQAAAARIERRAELEQLCKSAQGKDKSVYKLARARLDVFKAEDARFAEARINLAVICEKLEKLVRLEADAMYKARITLLENEWDILAAAASPELSQRYQQVLSACHGQIAARAEQIAQTEEEQALDQQAQEFVATANREIHQLLLALYELTDITTLPQYQQQLADLIQAVRLASQRPLDFGKALNEFDRAQRYALYWLEQLAAQGSLTQMRERHDSAHLNSLLEAAREFYRKDLPASLAALAEELEQWQRARKEAHAAEHKLEQELTELTRRGLWAARDGMVRKARGIHKEVSEKRPRLSKIAPALQTKFDELDAAIAQLSDWHEFAVTPKKEALIEQMQALVSSPLAPQDLASKIHELQDEWKSLSKGIQQADESLWQTFQDASHLAYAPCREFFEAQAREREQNLAHRKQLIEQLESYQRDYHWDTAVWADVEKTLKVARGEWQNYWPVPRKLGEQQQSRFDSLMDDIHARLKGHYQDNKATKQKLITEAQACVSEENLPQAIESIKQLQQRWKTIGKSYPKDDQHLWQAFRRECDAVFARRDQQQTERQQAQDAQLTQARSLIARLQALAALPYEELVAAREQRTEIKAAFHALGELPRENAKTLSTEFTHWFKAVDYQLVSGRNQAEVQSWKTLYTLADQLRRLELAQIAGQGDADAAAQLLVNPPRLPAAGLARLQARVAQFSKLTTADQTKHHQALQVLCIRAEILSGRETPTADKELRMQYQLQQLQQGLGQQKEQSLEDLAIEWVGLGGVTDPVYKALFDRFMQSLAKENRG